MIAGRKDLTKIISDHFLVINVAHSQCRKPNAGGIPVLAHPFLYKFSNEDTKHLIHDLKEEGLAGIEVYHSSHHIGQITKLRQWQKEYDLLATGGSDFHGTNKPDIEIGTGRGPLFVPDHLIDDLMN